MSNELMGVFTKTEIIAIAEELGLPLDDGRPTALQILQMIDDDLRQHGVPPEEDCSELLDDFLFQAGWIDEDGNPIAKVEVQPDVVLPECFSWADERDPSCKRCKVFEACLVKRIAKRPGCYGKLFMASNEDCMACLEASTCRTVKTVKLDGIQVK